MTDPITLYLKAVPADKRGITLHHLLTHSAGLRDAFGGNYDVMLRDSLVRLVLETELLGTPGTRYRYSNAGYSLLGAIIEKVSGQTYERFLHEALFAPLGMHRTGYMIPRWAEDELAHGYRDGEAWGTPAEKPWAPDGPYWNLRANGGILSTVGDLYGWHQALEGNAVLSEASKRKLFAPHVPESSGGRSHYGYGWAIFPTSRGTRLIAHDGGNGVFFADFRRYVDEGVVLIGATNHAGPHSEHVCEQVVRAVWGQEWQPYAPRVAVQLDPAIYNAYPGSYRFSPAFKVVVTREGDRLFAQATDQPRVELLPESETRFFAAPIPGAVLERWGRADQRPRGASRESGTARRAGPLNPPEHGREATATGRR